MSEASGALLLLHMSGVLLAMSSLVGGAITL